MVREGVTDQRCGISKIFNLIPLAYWPDVPEAISLPPGNDMQVKMEHGLLGSGPSRSDEVHAVRVERSADGAPDVEGRLGKVSDEVMVPGPEVFNVRARDDQRVARCSWIQREERDPVRTLCDHLGRLLATADPAEVA